MAKSPAEPKGARTEKNPGVEANADASTVAAQAEAKGAEYVKNANGNMIRQN